VEFTAACILRPETLELRRVPCRRLGPRDVLARVAAVGICGTDLGIYEGTLPYFRRGVMRYPVVPGHEWAGEVVAVGEAVRRVRPGDRVTAECHIG
jgi:D-arabinose 1-dehydrogenase-like Zn-dependent alcohol dehydrogenase